MVQMNIKSDSFNIKDFLKSFKFQVPMYQRSYKWSKNEVEDFWNDLNLAEEGYLLGAFVLWPGKDEYFEIIDGQQRLATITILFAVLRDLFLELSEKKLAAAIQSNYIGELNDEGEYVFRLKLGSKDYPNFKKYIQETSIDVNGKKVFLKSIKKGEGSLSLENYFFLRESAEGGFKTNSSNIEKIEKLKEIRDLLLDKISVICVRVDDKADAFTIFETLNYRGLSLTVSDLLKNLLFSKIKDRVDTAIQYWTRIEDILIEKNADIRRFIRHFWLSKFNFVTETYLYKNIKKEIESKKYKDDKIIDFLIELRNEATTYSQITQPDVGYWSTIDNTHKIYKTLCGISVLDVKQCYSLLLCLIRAFKNKSITGSKLKELFKFIEIFSFRNVISRISPTGLEKIYSDISIRINNANNKEEISIALETFKKIILKTRNPSNEALKDGLSELRIDSRNKKLITYILSEINYEGSYDEQQINSIDIEHVYPLNPSKEWNDVKKNIEEKELTTLLGNLTILSKSLNKKASNRPYKGKKEVYKESQLPINDYFNSIEKWDNEEILTRHDLLIDKIKNIWRLK